MCVCFFYYLNLYGVGFSPLKCFTEEILFWNISSEGLERNKHYSDAEHISDLIFSGMANTGGEY